MSIRSSGVLFAVVTMLGCGTEPATAPSEPTESTESVPPLAEKQNAICPNPVPPPPLYWIGAPDSVALAYGDLATYGLAIDPTNWFYFGVGANVKCFNPASGAFELVPAWSTQRRDGWGNGPFSTSFIVSGGSVIPPGGALNCRAIFTATTEFCYLTWTLVKDVPFSVSFPQLDNSSTDPDAAVTLDQTVPFTGASGPYVPLNLAAKQFFRSTYGPTTLRFDGVFSYPSGPTTMNLDLIIKVDGVSRASGRFSNGTVVFSSTQWIQPGLHRVSVEARGVLVSGPPISVRVHGSPALLNATW